MASNRLRSGSSRTILDRVLPVGILPASVLLEYLAKLLLRVSDRLGITAVANPYGMGSRGEHCGNATPVGNEPRFKFLAYTNQPDL